MRARLQALRSFQPSLPSISRTALLLAQLAALVFATILPAQAQSTFKLLYSFTGGTDGNIPVGSLFRDSAGNLYGMTAAGGMLTSCLRDGFHFTDGCGTLFRVDATGAFTVLHTFTQGADGAEPLAGLVGDAKGNLYGATTGYGYSFFCGPSGPAACGSVFKLDHSGNFSVLHDFLGSASNDGAEPSGPLTLDGQGNLLGVTLGGGTDGLGTVFKVTQPGAETVLHSFTRKNPLSGLFPTGGIVLDAAGNLYGTTAEGGPLAFCRAGTNQGGCGTFFKLDTSGNETVLYDFQYKTGWHPQGYLLRDAAGNFYGTTGDVGYCCGVFYEISSAGTYTSRNGKVLSPGFVRDAAGNLYGATVSGGAFGLGTIFKQDKKGKQKVLHTFTGGADGEYPNGVILDSAGNLYGTTSCQFLGCFGTVFELSLP
jgi:uncharacterized repeat protein (TIGR03803 family)